MVMRTTLLSKASCIDDFEIGVTLGKGSFGRVRFVTHKVSKQHYAIKILKKAEVSANQQVEHMKSEKKILEIISANPHPFIVSLAGAFQDARYLYMVLEYVVGGEFFTYLRNAERFSNKTAQFYAAHVVEVFAFLHSMDVIYRDLKPENLLLERDGYIKITDFGFAKKVEFKTFTLCGTPEYIAPEILLSLGHGKGVDWWTLGVLIYEMLVGEPPFADENPMNVYQRILNSTSSLKFPNWFDRNAKCLIKQLLTPDLTKRCGCSKTGVKDIKEQKWFAEMDWHKLLRKELEAPIKPKVKSMHDTSNFDEYPDSIEEAATPSYGGGVDPFKDF